MKERLLSIIVCPICKSEFSLKVAEKKDNEIISGTLVCGGTHEYAIKGGIPRLVSSDEYLENFSFEWEKFSKVQLDCFNGTTESEETFVRNTGFDKGSVKGRLVLDAGVGAGRFADVVSGWGAEVVGVDLSYAVEAAFGNIGQRPNVHIIQADIFKLPFRTEIFDYVFSIGVLHHTPDTRTAFRSLLPFLKKDGQIAVWLYAKYFEGAQRVSSFLRRFTTRLPKKVLYYLSALAVPLYYVPGRGILFPLLQFSLHRNARWRWLDTFDWYSPVYAWKHTYPEVISWFKEEGLKDIELPEGLLSVKARK
jgi:SAM-dependent methyltransferase